MAVSSSYTCTLGGIGATLSSTYDSEAVLILTLRIVATQEFCQTSLFCSRSTQIPSRVALQGSTFTAFSEPPYLSPSKVRSQLAVTKPPCGSSGRFLDDRKSLGDTSAIGRSGNASLGRIEYRSLHHPEYLSYIQSQLLQRKLELDSKHWVGW